DRGAVRPHGATELGTRLVPLNRGLRLELRHRARFRRFIRSPAHKANAVAKSLVLEPVESHLAHELRPHRFPGKVAVLRPAARAAGGAAALETGAATERLEQPDQLPALGVIETRRMPDVLEGLAPIHAEQQGAQ